ncbi:signal peptidase I [Candidatus Bathyarchaeota archaeon]|nr:signal peptidase I [Candidatus Bathyarchaeota archaeon]MDP6049373.1 signal peptidase I [Candidatus Bathyarchaeota archaeon]
MEGWKEYLKYIIFFVILAGLALGGMQFLKSNLKTKYPIMVVVSQSMVPTLGVGDFILVEKIDDFEAVVAESMPEGEILVFLRSSSTNEYIVHRAVDKFFLNGAWQYVTKGDNNKVQDRRSVSETRVVGKVIGRIPVLGYFPLFIKTSRGFLLITGLMALVFFADFFLPEMRIKKAGGHFPFLSLIPFLIAPLTLALFMTRPDNHLEYERFALAAWYIGCLVAPLAFDDDDMGMMLWLYHFVLVMIPLINDMVWWMTQITPSNWWRVSGSTVPLTWLFRGETPFFFEAFNRITLLLVPGCLLFFVITALKRRGVFPLTEISARLRRYLW